MKNKLIILIAFICITVSGCGGGDDDLNDIFIPNISNQWVSSRNTNFFFLAAKTNVNESDFTGSEQGGGQFNEFTGHFKNYDIEFTFTNGAEAGVKYKGKFIKGSNPLRIEAKGANNVNLTITQVLNN